MKINPQSFFYFCANHAPLLRALAERGGEFSDAEAMRLIRAHPGLGDELPPDLPARFARFSNRTLLNKLKNRSLLANLRRSVVPEIRQVLELIERHNAGLEQEALLL